MADDRAVQIRYPRPMALFQKKRLEDDLAVLPRPTPSSPPPSATEVSRPPQPLQRPQNGQSPSVTAAPQQSAYGIDHLVRLMRELPSGNVELVVRVLKKTLESVSISVPGLIQQASQRETELEERMAGHRRAIAALEDEIASKKRAIEELEAGYKEVMVVRERLNLALKLEQESQVKVTGAPPQTAPHDRVVTTIVGQAEVETPTAMPVVSDPTRRG